MHLVIFDIDGTLTNTNHLDHYCYFKAFSALYQQDVMQQKWEDFRHFTDSNITQEMFERILQRDPQPEEIEQLKAAVCALYDQYLETEKNWFAEVPGAREFVSELNRHPDVAVAFATGCWQCTAAYKLQVAEIPYQPAVLAHADEHIRREDIMQQAVHKAIAHYQTAAFSRITYFGDGIWDYHTCQKLNVPLIGIDCNGREVLQSLGVPHVFTDYLDRARLFQVLGI